MNFRKFTTSGGKEVLAGRDAESNEFLVEQSKKDEIVLHTKAAGSPFVNIKGRATQSDLREAAIFCAKYSQAWKKARVKRDIPVHWFKGRDIFKIPGMKTGTFGVKKFKEIIVRKEGIENAN